MAPAQASASASASAPLKGVLSKACLKDPLKAVIRPPAGGRLDNQMRIMILETAAAGR